jgi:glycine cleavage system H protein
MSDLAGEVRNFMGYMWYKKEDGVVTIGINEEGLEDFEEILSIELPPEGEKIESDVVLGTIETDDGPLDIYSPVDGTICEINSQVIDNPELIQDDPLQEGWLIKIETSDDIEEDEDDDDDDDDDEDDDLDDEDEDYKDEE